MATAELKPRKETKTQGRLERDIGRRGTRDDRRKQAIGIVVLVFMLVLFVLAIVLASIFGEPAELDPIDYWMMP